MRVYIEFPKSQLVLVKCFDGFWRSANWYDGYNFPTIIANELVDELKKGHSNYVV